MSFSVIALDGPAASGKTTVARRVAADLGFAFVGTGSMYRAVTLAILRHGLNPEEADAVAHAVRSGSLDFSHGFEPATATGPAEGWFAIDGHRASEDELSSDSVNAAVSQVAQVPVVREALVALQRSYAQERPVVMEGRDIGTVVFPETPWKFFVTASVEVRASRRAAQGQQDDLAARDQRDQTRQHSPLTTAADAVIVDSTELDLDQTVSAVLDELRQRGLDAAR